MAVWSEATPGVLRAVREMLEAEERQDYEGAEIVYARRGGVWIGNRQTSMATLNRMLRLGVVRSEGLGTEFERHTLNEEGRKLAREPAYKPALVEALERQAASQQPPPAAANAQERISL